MTALPPHARFQAFGTYGFLSVRRAAPSPAPLDLADQVVTDVDATCSRFRDDSDLSRANRQPGRWVDVDPLLGRAVEVACDAAARPAAWSPAARPPARAASATTATSAARARRPAPSRPAVGRRTGPGRVARSRPRPGRTAADPGRHGTGPRVRRQGLGGRPGRGRPRAGARRPGPGQPGRGRAQIAVPDGRPWSVAISEHPGNAPADPGRARLRRARHLEHQVRRWSQGGVARHHLLDPRTGRPAPESGAPCPRPDRPASRPTPPAPRRSCSASPPRPGCASTT